MSAPIVEVTHQYLAAVDAFLTNGDEAPLAAVLADDIRWTLPLSYAQQPLAGRDEVLELHRQLATRFAPGTRRATVAHLVAEGDLVALHSLVTGQKPDGRAYENVLFFIMRIADGRVHEVWESLDTLHAQRSQTGT